MSSLNKAMIIGNLGAEPDTRYMPSGDAVTNLSIATSEKWKDKQTGEPKERTEWHRVALFGRTAEVAAEYLHKGSKVYIEGQLQTRKWQDKDGHDRYTTEIKGQRLVMLDSKGSGQQSGQPSGQQQRNEPAQDGGGQPGPDDFDDDIPF